MRRRIWPVLTTVASLGLAMVMTTCTVIYPSAAAGRRELKVALYPFIPEFVAAADLIKRDFEAAYPQIKLNILDLRSNYYGSDDPNYIRKLNPWPISVDEIEHAD